MLLVLGKTIWITIKIIFLILYFGIKILSKIFYFILKKPYLRFPFLLSSLGYLFSVNFNTLATIYFIYLMHLSALKLNIYNKIYIDLKYLCDKLYNSYKVSHSLRSLKNDTIILNNIHLENNDDENCAIDELVITNSEIFAIKTLNLPYDNYINNISNKYNSDLIIDLSLLDTIFEECSNSYNILQEILSYDIPITNIIALPQENCVIKDNIDFDTPIITTKDLSYYIKSKINKNAKYSPLNIKENLLENKTWIFDTLISNLQAFYSHTKLLIAFLFIFLLSYYIYITFVSYVFFKFILANN